MLSCAVWPATALVLSQRAPRGSRARLTLTLKGGPDDCFPDDHCDKYWLETGSERRRRSSENKAHEQKKRDAKSAGRSGVEWREHFRNRFMTVIGKKCPESCRTQYFRALFISRKLTGCSSQATCQEPRSNESDMQEERRNEESDDAKK
jgi:hypothetical protein